MPSTARPCFLTGSCDDLSRPATRAKGDLAVGSRGTLGGGRIHWMRGWPRVSLRALAQTLGLVLMLRLESRVDAERAADERDGLGRLSLARDDTLEVPDVLLLSQAPAIVVLSGCETGLADPLALAGGMSLAQGFVIAGSQQVIASSGALGDAAAAGLMQDLYGAVASGEATDVDMALTLAQRRGTDEGRLYVQSFGP